MSSTASPSFAPTLASTIASSLAPEAGSPILSTFLAAIKSVGAVYVTAAAGIYLHRRHFVSKSGKKDLSHIYLQLALPLLFFTQFIYCEHDVAADSCPDVTKYLGEAWILLLWPVWVNVSGLVVGWVCAKLAKVPSCQTKAISAMISFASGTSLPVSLLTAIRYNTAADSLDPVLLLSVYNIFPVTFMIGNRFLKRDENEECGSTSTNMNTDEEIASDVVDGVSASTFSSKSKSDDEQSKFLRIFHEITPFFPPPVIGALLGIFIAVFPKLRGIFVDLEDRDEKAPLEWMFDSLYAIGQIAVPVNLLVLGWALSSSLEKTKEIQSEATDRYASGHNERVFAQKAMIAVVVGKMVVMPMVGIASAFLLHLFYTVPKDIANSFYLVILIVFMTPTTNAVFMMIESSGLKCQEGVSRAISLQYLVAPLILPFSVMATVYMADAFSA